MSDINISSITITEDELRTALIEKIASSIAWRLESSVGDKVKKSIEMLDQAVINRMVTEYLVAEHLGKMRGDE